MLTSRIIISLLLGLFALCATAQERTLLKGRVVIFDTPIESVHAKNLSSGKSTITNVSGEFLLSVQTGDTLLFSHVAMNDFIRFVYSDDIKKGTLLIPMNTLTNELEEVTVTDISKINAVSLGIIPKEIPIPTQNERRLQTAGDFKWHHLLGIIGGLQIDPILNAINGRTKQLKRNILIENKIKNISTLEGQRDYMQQSMNLNDEQMGRLIAFAAEEEKVQLVINSKNEMQIQLFLLDTWMKFKEDKE